MSSNSGTDCNLEMSSNSDVISFILRFKPVYGIPIIVIYNTRSCV